MNTNIKSLLLMGLSSLLFISCQPSVAEESSEISQEEEHHDPHIVSLSKKQQEIIGIETDTMTQQVLHHTLKISGKLGIPPQYEAELSTFMGGIVKSIQVKEGDFVKKGTILVKLHHPDFIALQREFQQTQSALTFLEDEYKRKKTLHNQEISSTKDFQKAKADYKSKQSAFYGLKRKLQLLGLNTSAILQGKIFPELDLKAPITGYINTIRIKTGQYVSPENELIGLSNNAKIFADFKIHQKDLSQIQTGQIIHFTLPNNSNKTLEAEVYAIGKTLDAQLQAVHVHAAVVDPSPDLIPGLYVDGRIQIDHQKVAAVPNEAIVTEGGKSYLFIKDSAATDTPNHKTAFRMVEVITGAKDLGFTEVKSLTSFSPNSQIVTKGAFYLQSDRTKEENEHSH